MLRKVFCASTLLNVSNLAIPGTLVNIAAGGGARNEVRFGHPSGTLKVGAAVSQIDDEWKAQKVGMSRSARVLMEGTVCIPDIF